MGYPSTKPFVMKYLLDHPNRPVTKEEIGDATGLEYSQVNTAVGNLIREGVEGVRRIVRGSIYQYDAPQIDPNGSEEDFDPEDPSQDTFRPLADPVDPEPEWFEQVGSTKKGAIVRGSDGTLYRLEAL